MKARTKARKRALDILFEADQRGANAMTLLAERLADPSSGPVIREYSVELVEGVVAHWGDINDALQTYSHGWPLDRMPSVDRAILRIGAFEVIYRDDVPDAVALSEAVELATTLSTDESPAFVNGLLARIAEVKATL